MINRKGIGLASVVLVVATVGIGLLIYGITLTPATSDPAISDIYYCSSGSEVQETINTIGSGNGMIYITNNITLSDSINIDGGGDYIIQGMGLVTIKIEGNYSAFNLSSASSCIFKELTFDGSSIIEDSISTIYIEEINDNPVYIQNVQFYRGARGINIESDRVWVKECTFNDLDYGLYVSHTCNIHVLNNTFDNIESRGIYCRESTESVFDGNIMENCDVAIHLYTECDNNVISNNIILNISAVGIRLSVCDYNSVVGNLIWHDSGERYYDYGIMTYESDYNAFIGNVIRDINSSDSGTGYGFYLESSNYNFAADNILQYNDVNSIYEDGCSGNVII